MSVRARLRALEKRLPPAGAAPSFTEIVLDLQRFGKWLQGLGLTAHGALARGLEPPPEVRWYSPEICARAEEKLWRWKRERALGFVAECQERAAQVAGKPGSEAIAQSCLEDAERWRREAEDVARLLDSPPLTPAQKEP